jgi:hypothetical protein
MEQSITVVDAAEKLLEEVGQPLHYKYITEVLLKQKIVRGKTPHQTVCARLSKSKRFTRVAEGTYALARWKEYKPARFAKEIAYDVLRSYGKSMRVSELGEKVYEERKFVGAASSVIRSIVSADRRFRYDKKSDLVYLVEWMKQ